MWCVKHKIEGKLVNLLKEYCIKKALKKKEVSFDGIFACLLYV